jgi:hypothetical protein
MKIQFLILSLLVSLTLNVYAGFRYLTQEIYKAGLTAGVQSGASQIGQVMNELLIKEGQVKFNRLNDKGQPEEIILIPKPNGK